jgi:hypothetical protein
LNLDREIALVEEVNTAIFLVREGLLSLEKLQVDGDLSHLSMLLLSNGFERLLKTIICLSALEKNPSNPDFRDIKRDIKTHNINDLLKRTISICKDWNYREKCAETKKDMVFWENCKDLQELVEILTNFGDKSGRYYNVDFIIGSKTIWQNPCKLFESYCNGKTVKDITTLLQRFARSLCRMFVWGQLGQTGKNMEQIVGDFCYLPDGDLGQVKPWKCE